MERYDALKLENQLCFPLYACAREVVKCYHPYLEELDLTYTQYITLMVLWQEESLSVKRLGERLYLDSGTLTPVLKSLENKGYVRRRRSCLDERVLVAAITEKGLDLREKAAAIPSKIAARMNLSQEEAEQLYYLLYKILAPEE